MGACSKVQGFQGSGSLRFAGSPKGHWQKLETIEPWHPEAPAAVERAPFEPIEPSEPVEPASPGPRQRAALQCRLTAMSSPQRHSPLAMDADTFRTLGHALVDQIAGLLASVPGRPVTPDESPSAVRQALDLNGPLPESGSDPATLLAEVAPRLFDHSLFNAHPRFFGYITAPPAPIGILGDFLASALNANVGAWRLSPAATELEIQTVRWVAQLIG